MKNYTQSPLPFQGQKRRFLNQFKEALSTYPKDGIYVDLFGGSGLLSHTVKQMYPDAKVIWNDFDNFQERLENIDQTNFLLDKIRVLLLDEPKDKRIKNSIRIEILNLLDEYNYVDYVTISSNILFSGKYSTNLEDLKKQTFYNKCRNSHYDATDYLDGVERLSMDYKKVFNMYKHVEKVVFLVDPPYLSTDTKSYSNDSYWKLKDYLDVLNVLDGSNFFYFTSNKSQIVELCEWIETRSVFGNPFNGSQTITTGGNVNYNSSYTDIMLYKKASD